MRVAKGKKYVTSTEMRSLKLEPIYHFSNIGMKTDESVLVGGAGGMERIVKS